MHPCAVKLQDTSVHVKLREEIVVGFREDTVHHGARVL